MQTAFGKLGNLALLHAPLSGFSAISDLPSTQPSAPELCNIGDAEGVAATYLKYLGPGHAALATSACILLEANCTVVQCWI